MGTCVCVYTHVHMYMCVFMQRPKVHVKSHPWSLFHLIRSGKCSQLNSELPDVATLAGCHLLRLYLRDCVIMPTRHICGFLRTQTLVFIFEW